MRNEDGVEISLDETRICFTLYLTHYYFCSSPPAMWDDQHTVGLEKFLMRPKSHIFSANGADQDQYKTKRTRDVGGSNESS